MEGTRDKLLQEKDDNRLNGEDAELINAEVSSKEVLKPAPSSADEKVEIVKGKGGQEVYQDAPPSRMDASGEVNMEASITADDVIRAGGFGARDDISSFLPVASDSTDFEAVIRGAREYEEPQGEISRPGLGWKETAGTK